MNVLLVKALANGLKAWRRCQTLDGWLLQLSVRVSRFWRTICESSVLYPWFSPCSNQNYADSAQDSHPVVSNQLHDISELSI